MHGLQKEIDIDLMMLLISFLLLYSNYGVAGAHEIGVHAPCTPRPPHFNVLFCALSASLAWIARYQKIEYIGCGLACIGLQGHGAVIGHHPSRLPYLESKHWKC
jgi:hypothetical protein